MFAGIFVRRCLGVQPVDRGRPRSIACPAIEVHSEILCFGEQSLLQAAMALSVQKQKGSYHARLTKGQSR
jgi:hypothetical protein